MAENTATADKRTDDGRATIGLGKETIDKLDKLRKSIGASLKEAHGIAVEPTRAQVVSSLIDGADKPADTAAKS